MAGFANDICYANNADFSIAGSQKGSSANGLLTNGQMWIGTTATNAGGTHINVGTLTSPDSSLTVGYSSPNITLQVAGGTTTGKTITGNTGGALAPTAGNWNILGPNSAITGYSPYTTGSGSTLTCNMPGTVKWVVNPTSGLGTHTTIADAITAASSGDDIFITPGTYTENLTLKAGVNLTGYQCDSSMNATGKVIIVGNITLSSAGSVTISGIQLQTNSAALLTVSGSVASIVNLENCYLNITNATGISYSSSSSSSAINLFGCFGNLGTTGIGIYSMSSTGTLSFYQCVITNSGASTTASSNSAGTINLRSCNFSSPLSTSSTGSGNITYCIIDTTTQNVTTLTTAGTGTVGCFYSVMLAGTASTVSIGAGTTVGLTLCSIASSNTNAVTGAGTLQETMNRYANSFGVNVTTQSYGYIKGSGTNTAPTGGVIGEQISSSASAVGLVTSTAKTITSINLTPGIWDVSAFCQITNTGSYTVVEAGISTTNNTLSGTAGIGKANYTPAAASALGNNYLAVPTVRAALSATTTYYIVAFSTFSGGAGSASAMITATRVA